MKETSELERNERERTSLLAEATRIVRAAEAESREVTGDEDARVLELMARVRTLDEQIGHLGRHHESNNQQKRNGNQ